MYCMHAVPLVIRETDISAQKTMKKQEMTSIIEDLIICYVGPRFSVVRICV